MWDKNSEAIVQWLPGDVGGVVNCLEGHPHFPIIATSGLDKDVKIWSPMNPDGVSVREIVQIFLKREKKCPNQKFSFSIFLAAIRR